MLLPCCCIRNSSSRRSSTARHRAKLIDLVELVASLLRAVLCWRQASLPCTWSEAFDQGYTTVFGNLALPAREKLREPPPWFGAAFVVLYEAVQQLWFAPCFNSSSAFLEPPRQRELTVLALDTLSMFPVEGNTCMAVLLLLRGALRCALQCSRVSELPTRRVRAGG